MEVIRILSGESQSLTPQYPVIAKVLDKIRLVGSQYEWWLVGLDHPLQHQGINYPCALLASRWLGHHLGGHEPTSAHLLLVTSPQLPPDAAVSNFPFADWCQTECVGT